MDKLPLSEAPVGEAPLDLWLNNAVGYILVRDVRDYARSCLDPGLSADTRAVALKAIDDALYGLAMVIDGVPEPLENASHRVYLETRVVLAEWRDGQLRELRQVIDQESFCMGYHRWLEGDFGTHPPFCEQAR